MYHSITFGTKNTWDDWHLIPKTRPLFNPPPVKTHYVDIPGGDGSIDLSAALAGRTLLQNRTGSFEFYVENGFRNWATLYSDIMAFLHGQKMRAILEDDPGYFYEGRFSVNAWKSEAQRSTIVIDYNVSPYKKSITSTDEDWIWDTFRFDTGVIQSYKDIGVDGDRNLIVVGDVMPVVPEIIASASGMSVTFNEVTYALNQGVNKISAITIQNGENRLQFHGHGSVTIKMNRGRP